MRYLLTLFVAASFAAGISTARGEDEVVETYNTRLSERDHHASDGYELTDAADIIRQDRANYHKFHKRDQEDSDDEFFAEDSNRERIAELFRKGHNSREMIKFIVEGKHIVQVTLKKGRDGLYLVVDRADAD